MVRGLYRIDIRKYGSKNIGTTNVFRTVGAGPAALVLLADMLKGIAAVAIVNFTLHDAAANLVVAIGALLGHNYSLFLDFKGGKGVATGLGLLLFLMPKVSAADLIIWFVIVILTRYVSIASITAAAVTPIIAWHFRYPEPYIIFGTFAGIFVIIGHNDNLLRLMNGTESNRSSASV
ncbi:MAG: glycerol-3-phosphate 1-O-acyltransferase PlsY [Phascolarctobacterium sp.]|nr:glycerol-3-phosphate 1-O-acyltransferase PlsY [Phascolarctobacterium sp.]